MNRRAFIQLLIGTAVVATIPIPKFLTPKEESIFMTADSAFNGYGSAVSFNASGGVLTQQMIEDAAMMSARNMGQPDVMYMSKKDYKAVAKMFGYRVVYRGCNIKHVRT